MIKLILLIIDIGYKFYYLKSTVGITNSQRRF